MGGTSGVIPFGGRKFTARGDAFLVGDDFDASDGSGGDTENMCKVVDGFHAPKHSLFVAPFGSSTAPCDTDVI